MHNQPPPKYIVTGGKKEFTTPHLSQAMRYYNNCQKRVGHYKLTMIMVLDEAYVCGTVESEGKECSQRR